MEIELQIMVAQGFEWCIISKTVSEKECSVENNDLQIPVYGKF